MRRPDFFGVIGCVLLCLLALPARASLRGVLVVDDSTKALVSINPSTGVATTLGTFSMGDFNAGGSMTPSSGEIYFMANTAGSSNRSLYQISNTSPGTTTTTTLSLPAGWQEIPYALTTRGTVNYGLFLINETTKGFGRIHTGGTVENLGTVAVGALPAGMAGQPDGAGVAYFVGKGTTGTDWHIFGVNTGGTLSYDQVISVPADRDQRPVFLEVSSSGTIYGVFRRLSASTGYLMTIDPTTGVATEVGGGFGLGDVSLGVSTLDEDNNTFYFTGYAFGDAGFRIQGIDLSTGSRVVNQTLSSASGYDPTPILLEVSAALGGAGTVPTTLTVTKNSVNNQNLDLIWTDACGEDVVDYTIHRGTIGDFTSHDGLVCTTSGATSKTIGQNADSYYFIIVPVTASEEGSYGADSAGAQRPRSSATCKTNQESSSCF